MNLEKSALAPGRPQSLGEEIANSVSHGVGLLAAVIATPILLVVAFQHRNRGFFIGTIVFALTLMTLYLASTLYHASPPGRLKRALRVFDHCAIFLLIAGTYTPFALGPMAGPVGFTMLGFAWALALFGTVLKATLGPTRASRLAMVLYLGTGWLALLFIRPLVTALPITATLWLFAGGIAYTSGVLFFVNDHRRYGHFLWHIFVVAGSCCHFCAVLACA